MIEGLSFALALSWHIGMENNYNEMHTSVRYERNYFIAGAYLNSMDAVSFYSGLRFDKDAAWVEVGAVTGYTVGLAPMLRVGYDFNETVAVFAAPAIEVREHGYGVGAVIGIEYTF